MSPLCKREIGQVWRGVKGPLASQAAILHPAVWRLKRECSLCGAGKGHNPVPLKPCFASAKGMTPHLQGLELEMSASPPPTNTLILAPLDK